MLNEIYAEKYMIDLVIFMNCKRLTGSRGLLCYNCQIISLSLSALFEGFQRFTEQATSLTPFFP